MPGVQGPGCLGAWVVVLVVALVVVLVVVPFRASPVLGVWP